jgi:hypothetical protein
LDDLSRLDGRLLQRPMVAVAVGRLHDHDVRVRERHRISKKRGAAGTEVAGEDHRPRAAVLLDGQLDAGRAQDMPRIDEASRNAGRDLDPRIVAYGTEQAPQARDVLLVVQGLEERLARTLPAPILALQVTELEAEGVTHDRPPQVEGRPGAEDGAGVTTLREEW